MALPPGITAKTVTLGIGTFFDGTVVSGRVTITAPENVVHLATNRPLYSSEMTKPLVDGVATFDLCPTDAEGLNNKSWTYKMKAEIQGAIKQPEVIYFLLPTAGPDTVDLDGLVTVPSSAGVPIAVDVVTAADLEEALAGVAGGSDPSDTGYDIVLLMGQSNMQGGGGGPTAGVDVTSPRLWAFPATGTAAGTVVQAADPLGHLNPSTSGTGPGTSFGLWYADTAPGNRRVLLVPCASSGSGFTGSGNTMRWDPFPSWPNDANNLYNRTVDQATAALAAAGPNARIVGALWVQGEADFNLAPTTYRQYLEALIDGLRSRLSLPDLPFVIGSMVPEYADGSPIDLIQQGTPARKRHTAYVKGPTGYLYATDGLGVHYTAAGARELGRRLVAGLAAARANTAPAGAVPDDPPGLPGSVVTVTPLASVTDTFTTLADTYAMQNGTFTVSGGRLQVPVTGAYGVMRGPQLGTLVGSSASIELISLPQTGAGASTYVTFGVTRKPGDPEGHAGFAFSGAEAGQPKASYVTPELNIGGTAMAVTNGGGGFGSSTSDRFYRVRESGGTIYWETSPDGTTWTTRASVVNPGLDLTNVSPFWQGGHWNAAEPDDVAVFDNLNLFG